MDRRSVEEWGGGAELLFRWIDGWQDRRMQIDVFLRAFEVDHAQQ